jgi:hypothetical protein
MTYSEAPSQQSVEQSQESHKKSQAGHQVVWPAFEPGTSQTQTKVLLLPQPPQSFQFVCT